MNVLIVQEVMTGILDHICWQFGAWDFEESGYLIT